MRKARGSAAIRASSCALRRAPAAAGGGGAGAASIVDIVDLRGSSVSELSPPGGHVRDETKTGRPRAARRTAHGTWGPPYCGHRQDVCDERVIASILDPGRRSGHGVARTLARRRRRRGGARRQSPSSRAYDCRYWRLASCTRCTYVRVSANGIAAIVSASPRPSAAAIQPSTLPSPRTIQRWTLPPPPL